jgi:hypothetical protein
VSATVSAWPSIIIGAAGLFAFALVGRELARDLKQRRQDKKKGNWLNQLEQPQRRTAPIPGLRGWRLYWHRDAGQPVLGSVVRPYLWDGPLVRDPKPPSPQSSTGFYAFPATPEAFRRFMNDITVVMGWNIGRYCGGLVFGRVSLFGRVIEHDHGYRAEAARVDKLVIRAGPETNEKMMHVAYATSDHSVTSVVGWQSVSVRDLVAALERVYDCPVVTVPNDAHPKRIWDELVKEEDP